MRTISHTSRGYFPGPASTARISGVLESGKGRLSMTLFLVSHSIDHRHLSRTVPGAPKRHNCPQAKNSVFMYSNAGIPRDIPNEFSGCTLKEISWYTLIPDDVWQRA